MRGFRVVDHRVPCQHIREYPRALANEQEDILHLAVKQYLPENNPFPQAGDVTIVAAHANGFPKELYEPLWEDLLIQAQQNNWRIRSIWMADVAHQGESYVANEKLLGNDPNWNDHSRDLLNLINIKRDEMPQPIIGIGHSMGGGQLVNLSYFHPRLLRTLVLIDPVIQERTAEAVGDPTRPSVAQLSTFRRDLWPSREEAAKLFAKSPFYKRWNPRVLEKWVEFGLRNTPTLLHSEEKAVPVTLTTPVPQEVYQFVRPNYDRHGSNGRPMNRVTHPDIDPALKNDSPFYRAEPVVAFYRLGELRPSALYLFGSESDTSNAGLNQLKLDRTGAGVGGSGGVKEGRVKGVTFEGIGHLVAMEAVERTAEEIGKWVAAELQLWRNERQWWNNEWKPKSLIEKQALDERWKKEIGGPLVRAKKSSKM